eukprot:TRINITY_DN538_c0_g1_i1.p1 TRINITY_DN538_c0_g1~~TRINITY_DN538_c0_g1_i1.p1  ORF type:complete len:734 (-),score=333.88 TRINITY_DN538_c0_g1_i1:1404-3605(-)
MEKVSTIGRKDLANFKRVVIKVGTSVVSNEDGSVALDRIGNFVEQISQLLHDGKEVILVTSGAVMMGKRALLQQTIVSTPLRAHVGGKVFNVDDPRDLRACAAAGQFRLMALYDILFSQKGVQCSQILLTDADFHLPEKRANLRLTLNTLLKLGILPILNENDVVTMRSPTRDDVAVAFWDNDSLACLIAAEAGAKLLVLLTDVEGLYKKPPAKDRKNEVIHTYIPETEFKIGSLSKAGRGGMQAKIDAALNAVKQGVTTVVIASGYMPNVCLKIIGGERIGTLFTQHPDVDKTASGKSIANHARRASRLLQKLSNAERCEIMLKVADALLQHQAEIVAANQKDVEAAERGKLAASLVSRLKLNADKLAVLADGIRQLARSEPAIGRVLRRTELADGLVLQQETSPIGVLMVIFESRPDALPQVAALSFMSGNGLLVKGGKEAAYSNALLHRLITDTIFDASGGRVPRELIHLVESRDDVHELLQLDEHIDLVIPRGSSQLVANIKANTKIPVLGHADGVCHVYIDQAADMDKARRLVLDAKTDYPAACNAVETLLVHEALLDGQRIQRLLSALRKAGVQLFGGPRAAEHLSLNPMTDGFRKEYSSLAMTVELVDGLDQAIEHINKYGSSHTDAIITEHQETAVRFQNEVDSACVFHNCSTRFADGYRFGLGAEVGISTGRIGARGPVGIEGLLTCKWRLTSAAGEVVADFSNQKKRFTHKPLPLEPNTTAKL